MQRIVALVCIILSLALPGFAQELEPSVTITSEQMRAELTEGWNSKVYVRGSTDKEVDVYSDTSNPASYGKLIALNLMPDEITYIYTGDKKVYKKLYSRLRYYAGRNYDFGGYCLLTEKEGVKEINGVPVYRIWVMKVLRPRELVVQHDVYYPGPPPGPHPAIIIDVFGWPWHHGHHGHHGPPPHGPHH